MPMVEMGNDILRLRLLPEQGGRIASLQGRAGGAWVDLLVPAPLDLTLGRWGMFPLAPYCNRIRDAAFCFENRQVRLPTHPLVAPHAMHGPASAIAWHLIGLAPEQASMATCFEGAEWPWPLRMTQRVRVGGSQVRVELSITNLGASAMPAGLGFHPCVALSEGVCVRLRAGWEWRCDAGRFPLGRLKLTEGIEVDAATPNRQYRHFSDWNRSAVVHRKDGTLTISASDALSCLVVLVEPGSHVCIEPMSHVTGALNAPAADQRALGLAVLQPGSTLSGEVAFTWQEMT